MIFEQLNPGACKTYLVASEATKEAMLVDPLAERAADYEAELKQRGLTLKYVVDTHVHADHLSGGALMKKRTGAQYLMHHNSVAGCVDHRLHDGDRLHLGELEVKVMHTPGHTQDSVTLKLPDRLLTGDFLFIGEGGAGRTDLPGGDAQEHWEALQHLRGLPDELEVYPGHDYHHHDASTLGEERRKNPRLATARGRDDYVRWLDGQVLGPAEWMKDVIAANYGCATDAEGLHIPHEKPACEVGGTKGDAVEQLVVDTTPAKVAQALAGAEKPLIVDVREQGEFLGELGHIAGARLVPLGTLSHRAAELAQHRHEHVVVVCRSGGRSAVAAAILTAAGFTRVQSMTGGMLAWSEAGLPVNRQFHS